MRGGRQFSARPPRSGEGAYGSKFRGSHNSYRDDDRGGYGGFNKGPRARYPPRSPDRFGNHSHDRSSSDKRIAPRDDSLSRKRPRHEGGRRDFGSNLSDNNRHGRHSHSNGESMRGSSHPNQGRNSRRPSPPPPPPKQSPMRIDKGQLRVKDRDHMGPPSRPPRKFINRPAPMVREKIDTNPRLRRNKILAANMRRLLVNTREVRRAKILRSTLKTAALKRVKMAISGAVSDDIDGAKKKVIKKVAGPNAGDDADLEANDDAKSENAADDNGEQAADEDMADIAGSSDLNAAEADRKIEIEIKKKLRIDDKDKRKKHVTLWCVHCRIECATFKEYNNHLHSRGHKSRLSKFRMKQEARLAQMRMTQRTAQNELEATMDTDQVKPQFCLLCHLYYRTPKDEHRDSDSHRKMKQFLLPYCTVCRIPFKSPMAYETHRCSVEHLRRKSQKSLKGSDLEDDEDNELQVDLDHFLTVDSVGDVDGSELSYHDESDDNAADTPAAKQQQPHSQPADARSDINVGSDHVKRIEVSYCELCRYYLPHLEDADIALQKHCSTRNHLRAYLRYKENQSLRAAAELIHRRDHEEKQTNKKEDAEKSRADSVTKTDDESTRDKMWDDNDKDGDESKEIENNNEDEDDASVERYDRFKNSEKTDEPKDEIAVVKDLDSKSEAPEPIEIESALN